MLKWVPYLDFEVKRIKSGTATISIQLFPNRSHDDRLFRPIRKPNSRQNKVSSATRARLTNSTLHSMSSGSYKTVLVFRDEAFPPQEESTVSEWIILKKASTDSGYIK